MKIAIIYKTILLLTILINSKIFGQLILKQIKLNNLETKLTDTLRLNALDNQLQLEFLDLKPHKNKIYKYRLAKKSENVNWIYSQYPTARFDNIVGGDYLFCIFEEGSLNKKVLIIQKKQVFWQKWWFWPLMAFYLLLFFGIFFYLFFLYKYRQKLKLQTIRNQIAADLHDEVGSNLSSISLFVEVIKQNTNYEANLYLDKIKETAKESIYQMQDAIWLINARNDTFEELINRLRIWASTTLNAKNIKFKFELGDVNYRLDFTMEQRKNCYMLVKEAINNAIKHANASTIFFEVRQEGKKVMFRIEDDGVGYNQGSKSAGNGLNNFKLRAKEANLKLIISSEKGKGTIIIVEAEGL